MLVMLEPEREATMGRIQASTGDSHRRVHPPDADLRAARPAAVKAVAP
jgi:hypothetical protein